MDVVTKAKRSLMMGGIKGKDTKPEITVRKILHGCGFRYRVNVKTLPGKPDIVLKKYKAVVFVNGCFWHGHKCHLFKLPASNRSFWQDKIRGNKVNDRKCRRQLEKDGWRIADIWECAVKGKKKQDCARLSSILCKWITGSDDKRLSIGYAK